jgi:hypothetical protein
VLYKLIPVTSLVILHLQSKGAPTISCTVKLVMYMYCMECMYARRMQSSAVSSEASLQGPQASPEAGDGIEFGF